MEAKFGIICYLLWEKGNGIWGVYEGSSIISTTFSFLKYGSSKNVKLCLTNRLVHRFMGTLGIWPSKLNSENPS